MEKQNQKQTSFWITLLGVVMLILGIIGAWYKLRLLQL
jgi:hypothetical protein